MSKQLTFKYNGKEFILEYTKKTVQQMEKSGFVADELTTKPMTTLPRLFAGAFLSKHRFAKESEIDDIYEKLTNKEALLEKLVEMYNEPFTSLFDEPDEDAEGNVDWEASF